jgi:hypothetical protein
VTVHRALHVITEQALDLLMITHYDVNVMTVGNITPSGKTFAGNWNQTYTKREDEREERQ